MMQSHSYSSERIKKGYSQSEVEWCRFLSQQCEVFFFVLVWGFLWGFFFFWTSTPWATGQLGETVMIKVWSSWWWSCRHLRKPPCELPITVERKEEIYSFSFLLPEKIMFKSRPLQIRFTPRKALYSHWYYE